VFVVNLCKVIEITSTQHHVYLHHLVMRWWTIWICFG